MADITVLNTTADLSGKTIVTAEGDRTITGLLTYSRGAATPPFAVAAAAGKVANLDADLLDSQDGTYYTNASNLASGTVAEARLGSGTGTVNKVLRGNNTWGDPPSVTTDGASRTQQIAFAAAQSASTDVNTLDDYEEGTWTPTITGSTSGAATYTTQVGHYVKIGQLVHVTFNITTAGAGTLVGNVLLGGLPFTVAAFGATYAPLGPVYWAGLAAGTYVNMIMFATQNTTAGSLFGATGAAAALTGVPVSIIGAATTLAGTITYRATA